MIYWLLIERDYQIFSKKKLCCKSILAIESSDIMEESKPFQETVFEKLTTFTYIENSKCDQLIPNSDWFRSDQS